MKHALIVAHPNAHSYTTAIAAAYASAVRARGDTAIVRDLYRMEFDPCLHSTELPQEGGFGPRADVVSEREALADVDVFALFYPLWFNAPPAMMKGYVERVFSMGFGYKPGPGGQQPMLEGRKLISFTSSGAPESWLHETGAFNALYTLFDKHVAGMCGLEILEHSHVGGVTPGFPEMALDEAKAGVRNSVGRHFTAASWPAR